MTGNAMSGKGESILIVDDTPENLKVLSEMLRGKGYEVRPVPNGNLALQAIRSQPPDLILLDINMPEMNGFEVCEKIKKEEALKKIPIIFISALTETLDKVKAFSIGGVDYIIKPFQFEEVLARVETHLKLNSLVTSLEEKVRDQVKEITASQMATIMAMARLAQSRDDDTGTHLERVQGYCLMLVEELAHLPQYNHLIDAHFIDLVFKASALHDIGKVGIPDEVLLKPRKLTIEEHEIMRRHTTIGSQTLLDVYKYYPQNEFIQMGVHMARWHHEKWDGTGYPDGLIGEAIPLEARIMAVADCYDALKSKRCYKKAFSHKKTCEIINEECGKALDPDLIATFNKVHMGMYYLWEELQRYSVELDDE